MIRYGQYCPIAKALELLAERWTLLIVRELLMGSRRYNELRRGMPLIAPSVMSQRLKVLANHGIIVREPEPEGRAINTASLPRARSCGPSSCTSAPGDSAGRAAGWLRTTSTRVF